MPTTGDSQWPYPNTSAVPDVPADFLLLTQRLDLMASGWTVCADATARAALVTNGDAFEGLHVYQIDTGITYVYKSLAWEADVAGSVIFTRNATQSIANSSVSDTVVVFDTTVLTSGAFTNSSGVLTCVTAGTYRFTGWIEYAGNSSGVRMLGVQKALQATPTSFVSQREVGVSPGAATIDAGAVGIGVVAVAAGDKVQLVTRQNSGGALNLVAAGLELVRII